jgi:hypothetical protein
MIARVVATALLLVFALASCAWAECAWVLWGAYEEPRAMIAFRQYRPIRAFPRGSADCEGERRRYERGHGWVDFVCLPETVDPRGPKEATR